MRIAHAFASGFGIGHAPIAPGTIASAAALLSGWAMLDTEPMLLAVVSVMSVFGGIWAIHHARVVGDPGWVVIDEFAGQWITLLGLASDSALDLLLAFVLFRILDITKPGPVGWADRQHGTFGIMGDDVIAGLLGASILYLLHPAWPMIVPALP
ncbi:MAG: phosphatidylglycerophosphatase A [Acetobacteraceae bacterium]